MGAVYFPPKSFICNVRYQISQCELHSKYQKLKEARLNSMQSGKYEPNVACYSISSVMQF